MRLRELPHLKMNDERELKVEPEKEETVNGASWKPSEDSVSRGQRNPLYQVPKVTLDNYREQTTELGGVDGSDGLGRSNRGAFIGMNTWLMSIQPEKKSWRWRAETTLSRNFALQGRRGIGQYLEGEVGSGEGCFWFFFSKWTNKIY